MFLPIELEEYIISFLPFEKTLNYPFISKLKFNPAIHNWCWAAKNGHLDVVDFFHNNRTEGCTTWTMDYAAYHGHLDVVKFLHINRTEGCTTLAMDWAAWKGHLEIVKWLHNNRTEGCTINAIAWAADNLEVVKFLMKVVNFDLKG